MAESITISNSYICYITNQPYVYPSDNAAEVRVSDRVDGIWHRLNTGWHIVPTMLWKHFVSPKAWYELTINYEAYRVDGYHVTMFNMIPMTTQLAIGGDSIFTAFNNCVYALAYQDKLYETGWHNWYDNETINDFNLLYKEGLMMNANANSSRRFVLPRYLWPMTNPAGTERWTWNLAPLYTRDQESTNVLLSPDGAFPSLGYYPGGLVWDPFNRPDELKELRPGKNSVGFSWERHECDSERWFNVDQIAAWCPYMASGPYNYSHQRPGTLETNQWMDPTLLSSQYQYNAPCNDYTIPNWSDMPIVPMQWWWKEMQQSINIIGGRIEDDLRLKYMDLWFNGTESECYKYGPTQTFIKMIPMINDQNVNIECSAQIAVKTQLKLSVKKRRSAIFCPTWGPLPWRAVYAANSKNRNFMNTMVRYRTGGQRRSWQNCGGSANYKSHPRYAPFQNTPVSSGTGQDGTRARPIVTRPRPKAETRVTPSAPPMDICAPISDPIYPPLDQFLPK